MNPFLLGKKNLSVPPLRPLTTQLPAGMASAAGASARICAADSGSSAQPTVEVVKEGDKVIRLVVLCGCGERIEIECLYPGNG